MRVPLAGYVQSRHPSLCPGCQRVLHLGWQEGGCGSGFSHYSLQPPVPLLFFFLPRKEESLFPSWLRGSELPGRWNHNWVAWSRPRQGCSLILHQTGDSLIGFSSLTAVPLQKNDIFYREVKKILGPLFIILFAISLVHVRNHLYL